MNRIIEGHKRGPQKLDPKDKAVKVRRMGELLQQQASFSNELLNLSVGLYKPLIKNTFDASGRSSTDFEQFMHQKQQISTNDKGEPQLNTEKEQQKQHTDNEEEQHNTETTTRSSAKTTANNEQQSTGNKERQQKNTTKNSDNMMEAMFDAKTKSAYMWMHGEMVTTQRFIQADKSKGKCSQVHALFSLNGNDTLASVLGLWWGVINEPMTCTTQPLRPVRTPPKIYMTHCSGKKLPLNTGMLKKRR